MSMVETQKECLATRKRKEIARLSRSGRLMKNESLALIIYGIN